MSNVALQSSKSLDWMLLKDKSSCKEKHISENMQRVACSFLLKKNDVMSGVPHAAENEGNEHHMKCRNGLMGGDWEVGMSCVKEIMPIV